MQQGKNGATCRKVNAHGASVIVLVSTQDTWLNLPLILTITALLHGFFDFAEIW